MKKRTLAILALLLAALLSHGALRSPSTTISTSGTSTTPTSSTSLESSTDVSSTGTTTTTTSPLPSPRTPIVYRAYQCGDDSSLPAPVEGLPEPKEVAAGLLHSLALDKDGHVWAWGNNQCGQLAQPLETPFHAVPVRVAIDVPVVAIAAGWFHSLAIDADGHIWTWGSNLSGQLGRGTMGLSGEPVPARMEGLEDVRGIAGGMAHSVALAGDIVYAWGNNFTGQVGGEGMLNLLTFLGPVEMPADPASLWEWLAGYLEKAPLLAAKRPVEVIRGAKGVGAGALHTLAVMTDGSARSWGSNLLGECGQGGLGSFAAPVGQVVMPLGLPLTRVVSLCGGMFYSLALREDGTVFAWGYNQEGQLGFGVTYLSTSMALPILALKDVRSISTCFGHSLACRMDGTVRGWGLNPYGQLGDGSIQEIVATPVPMNVAGAKRVAAGGTHSLVIAP